MNKNVQICPACVRQLRFCVSFGLIFQRISNSSQEVAFINQIYYYKQKPMSKDYSEKHNNNTHNAAPFQPQLQFIQEYCKNLKKQLKLIPKQSLYPSGSKALQSPPSLLLIHMKEVEVGECRQLSKSAYFRAPPSCMESQWTTKKQQAKYERKGITKPLKVKDQLLHHQPTGNQSQGYFSKNKLADIDDDRLYTFSSTSETLNNISAVGIQDFEIGRKLGSGKSGSVFMAMHKKTNMIFALKIINKQRKSPKFWEQLSRQIKIQSFLNHPNVVKLYCFFSDAQNIYLVQQLCLSGELHTLLNRRHSLSEQTVRIITEQLCGALDYLHFHKVIHRDLKPENILYQEGVIKISDFGWSISSPLLRSTLCGTPVYLSPEAIGKKHYDHKIDVWSVGILTYQLLFGCVPFLIEKRQDLSKIITDDIKFPQNGKISITAKDFIKTCLQKNPKKRRSIRELLRHPFISDIDYEQECSQLL